MRVMNLEEEYSGACHAFEGHSGTAKIKLACHKEPVEFPKERRYMIIFARAAHNMAGTILNDL